MESSSLPRDQTLGPLHWEHGVLANGPAGKSLCLFFMDYLCRKYDKPITVHYYIAGHVSWVPRLTLLDLTNKLDL